MRPFPFILILLISMVSYQSKAQFKLGLTALNGPGKIYNTRSAVIVGESMETKFRYNFAVGGSLGYCFSDWINIQADVFYDQINSFQGYYIVAEESGTYYTLPAGETAPLDWKQEEYWSRWSFLSIPLTFNFKVKKFSLILGGQYSFLLRGGGRGHYMSYEFNYDYQTNFDHWSTFQAFNRSNFSSVMGFRVDLPKNIGIEARYVHGFSNLYADWAPYKTYSRQILFGLSYMFLPKEKKDGCGCY